MLTGGPPSCPEEVTGGIGGPPVLGVGGGDTHMALAPSCLYNFGR